MASHIIYGRLWVAESTMDRHILAVCFLLVHLVSNLSAILYATKLARLCGLQRITCLQAREPDKNHVDPSLWYKMQHSVGGVTGLIVYGACLYAFAWLLPASYKEVTALPRISYSFSLIAMTDFFMYILHRATHHTMRLKRWSGHYKHHQIVSPTAHTAIMGSFAETIILAWIPPLLAVNVLPFLTFTDAAAAAFLMHIHLTQIHSDKDFVYDEFLHKLGIVTTKCHHVHHLRQKKNLAHVFWIWDYLGGTYMSWEELGDALKNQKRVP